MQMLLTAARARATMATVEAGTPVEGAIPGKVRPG
jgi:hypothetical protein